MCLLAHRLIDFLHLSCRISFYWETELEIKPQTQIKNIEPLLFHCTGHLLAFHRKCLDTPACVLYPSYQLYSVYIIIYILYYVYIAFNGISVFMFVASFKKKAPNSISNIKSQPQHVFSSHNILHTPEFFSNIKNSFITFRMWKVYSECSFLF